MISSFVVGIKVNFCRYANSIQCPIVVVSMSTFHPFQCRFRRGFVVDMDIEFKDLQRWFEVYIKVDSKAIQDRYWRRFRTASESTRRRSEVNARWYRNRFDVNRWSILISIVKSYSNVCELDTRSNRRPTRCRFRSRFVRYRRGIWKYAVKCVDDSW